MTYVTAVFDTDIKLGMVLPNKVDTRTKLGEEYLESFRADSPALAYVS